MTHSTCSSPVAAWSTSVQHRAAGPRWRLNVPAPTPGEGKVVAIDIHGVEPIAGVTILKQDFLEHGAPEALIEALGGDKADVVMSDMAAHATGHKQTDHLKIMALAEAALMFAREVLKPDGTFICKVLRGGAENELLRQLKNDFRQVKHFKPEASRDDSAELFLVALGFRASPA